MGYLRRSVCAAALALVGCTTAQLDSFNATLGAALDELAADLEKQRLELERREGTSQEADVAVAPAPLPGTASQQKGGRVLWDYVVPRDSAYMPIYRNLATSGFLESFAGLEDSLLLPTDLTVATEEWGVANAFYDPRDHRIRFCYELFYDLAVQFRGVPRDQMSSLFGSTVVFITAHELGHAFVHLFSLPITGLEEDVADQFATSAMLSRPDGSQNAIEAAVWFRRNAETGGVSHLAYSDEHSLNAQRFYNILCWVYGSDPQGNANLVHLGVLRSRRAERCPNEYAQIQRSWDSLMAPHTRTR